MYMRLIITLKNKINMIVRNMRKTSKAQDRVISHKHPQAAHKCPSVGRIERPLLTSVQGSAMVSAQDVCLSAGQPQQSNTDWLLEQRNLFSHSSRG